MQTVELGRTGLRVSVAGLGCGGHSRLGQGYGASRDASVDLVKTALDLGVDFIDTAAVYGTEEIVGAAIAGRRQSVVISTKLQIVAEGASSQGRDFISAETFMGGLEGCLRRLGTDYVDILHLHGVMPAQYDYCARELVPALIKLREQGKIRFLGLTERFIHDPQHRMLSRALDDDCWDVVMAGFNLINQSARARVFGRTGDKGVGSLLMFAVRRALSDPQALKDLIAGLAKQGLVETGKIDLADPLGFLHELGGARGVVDGAYRFCRHEAGADVILTGTGNPAHLKENIESINSEALSGRCVARLGALFGAIDSVSGN
jgi:L-galactose dehydrogenase